MCVDNLFEEVEPAVILKDRKNENGTRDFLVKWADGEEDTWVRCCTLMENSRAKLGWRHCLAWEGYGFRVRARCIHHSLPGPALLLDGHAKAGTLHVGGACRL